MFAPKSAAAAYIKRSTITTDSSTTMIISKTAISCKID